jgi:primase-polymerase (primpol)-like protein
MVINPDYSLSKNKHQQTDHTYLAVKAYWLDDEGKKVRQFARSMGREESYKGGIDGDQAWDEGLKVIQPVIYEYYKNIYPD